MTDSAAHNPGGVPPITSRADFAAAVLWGVQTAAARQARQLWCVDRDFADWPLGAPALLDTLTRWLRLPQRRLVLLAATYDEVASRHPRFVRWRADWSHAVEAWSPPEELSATLPCVLVDDGPVSVQLHDALRWRGRASLEVRDALLWRHELDVVLQRSTPAFPVRQLGL
jgi:hypothetical protein